MKYKVHVYKFLCFVQKSSYSILQRLNQMKNVRNINWSNHKMKQPQNDEATTVVLSAPGGPHVGPMNLTIRVPIVCGILWW